MALSSTAPIALRLSSSFSERGVSEDRDTYLLPALLALSTCTSRAAEESLSPGGRAAHTESHCNRPSCVGDSGGPADAACGLSGGHREDGEGEGQPDGEGHGQSAATSAGKLTQDGRIQ